MMEASHSCHELARDLLLHLKTGDPDLPAIPSDADYWFMLSEYGGPCTREEAKKFATETGNALIAARLRSVIRERELRCHSRAAASASPEDGSDEGPPS